jgi:large conductance mechanosensitive channel
MGIKGFIDFIRKQGVVGLAIGFILGGALSTLVSSIVTNLVNPIVGILLGKAQSLSDASFVIGTASINYGKFLNDFINFVVIAAVVYFIVRGFHVDKLDKPKDAP